MKQVHRGGAFFLLGLTIALGGSPALEAQELTRPLTPEQVDCNALQLERLLYRSHVQPLRAGKLHSLFVTYNEHSLFEGLGVSRAHPRRIGGPEAYLAFHLNPDVRPHLLNPARPPLGQISLTREESSSNLVPQLVHDAMFLQVNPLAVVAGDPPWSAPGVLGINNFQPGAAGVLTSDVRPGRGLENDGLLTVCHTNFTAFDRWVFSLLQRMLVAESGTLIGGGGPEPSDMEAAIFRGEDPHIFRINVYPAGARAVPGRWQAAAELRIDWTPDGRLTTGWLELLPLCSPSRQKPCTLLADLVQVHVALAPPAFNQERRQPRFGTGYTQGLTEPQGRVDVDFAALLAGTAWNDGGWVAPQP
jgi:hypothetical protein